MSADKHTTRWFGVIPGAGAAAANQDDNPGSIDWHGDLRVPRNKRMNGGDWSWDVTCSCGWDSRTGGGTEAAVKRSIADHRWDVTNGFWTPEEVSP